MDEAGSVRDYFHQRADPAGYLPRPASERTLAVLSLAVLSNGAPVLLLGPAGIGKTLVLRVLAERLGLRSIYLPYPMASAPELCRWAMNELGESSTDDPEAALLAQASRGDDDGLLLLVDDGDALPYDTARRLFELSNNSGGRLRVLIAATDATRAERVFSPLHEDLTVVRFDEPMTVQETHVFVRERLREADDATRQRFGSEALESLHHESEGIPASVLNAATTLLRAAPAAVPTRTAARALSEIGDAADLDTEEPRVPELPAEPILPPRRYTTRLRRRRSPAWGLGLAAAGLAGLAFLGFALWNGGSLPFPLEPPAILAGRGPADEGEANAARSTPPAVAARPGPAANRPGTTARPEANEARPQTAATQPAAAPRAAAPRPQDVPPPVQREARRLAAKPPGTASEAGAGPQAPSAVATAAREATRAAPPVRAAAATTEASRAERRDLAAEAPAAANRPAVSAPPPGPRTAAAIAARSEAERPLGEGSEAKPQPPRASGTAERQPPKEARTASAAPAAAVRPTARVKRVLISVSAEFGARIEIDGKPVGSAPLEDIEVRVGRRRIVARLADGSVMQRTVEVGDDARPVVFY